MSAIRITGATRIYAILGNPIAQVKSPEGFSERFATAGMNAVMIPLQVLPGHFDQTIIALKAIGNLDGLIMTVPYKAEAARFADRLGPTASKIRALNAMRREPDGTWTGEMFDGKGFVRGARAKGAVLEGRNVALFGAGGAGSAIGCELAAAGVASLGIIDPQAGRATALAQTLAREFPGCRIAAVPAMPAGADMIVNASTVGMRDTDGMPGDIGTFDSGTIVGDVIVSETPTALLRHALAHGCTVVSGRDMFFGQLDSVVSFFARG